MITNTQRILYEDGYYPAYAKRKSKRVLSQGYCYTIEKFEEVKTTRVFRMELESGLVSYFSDCAVFLDMHWPRLISDIKVGDNVLTSYGNFKMTGEKTFARVLAKAFVLDDKQSIENVCKRYKLKKMNHFKLLANDTDLIGDFLCEIVRYHIKDFRQDNIIIKNVFHYELLQELILAFSMFGVKTKIEKEHGKWVLFIERASFMKALTNLGGYLSCTQVVTNIHEIKQPTQSFVVKLNVINQITVNGVLIQGD